MTAVVIPTNSVANVQTFIGKEISGEPRLTVVFPLDFTAGGTLTADLNLGAQLAAAKISFFQSLKVDNTFNAAVVDVYFNGSQDHVRTPPNSIGVYQVNVSNPPNLTITCSGGTGVCTFALTNVLLTPTVASTVSVTSPFIFNGSGYALVSDPILDGAITAGVMQVAISGAAAAGGKIPVSDAIIEAIISGGKMAVADAILDACISGNAVAVTNAVLAACISANKVAVSDAAIEAIISGGKLSVADAILDACISGNTVAVGDAALAAIIASGALATNIARVAGTVISTGLGSAGTGTPRVTVAADSNAALYLLTAAPVTVPNAGSVTVSLNSAAVGVWLSNQDASQEVYVRDSNATTGTRGILLNPKATVYVDGAQNGNSNALNITNAGASSVLVSVNSVRSN